ncbi:hypothetical protein ANN_27250 [Periplaneta americana]|uniref:Uncharacterized protein n=1 Tax=Periplaneta americana TaxID=6978 RepID=A0ABQ8RXN1_PERAM|nr:hypothetical protein ANN_27250 [Periplaneta americana]
MWRKFRCSNNTDQRTINQESGNSTKIRNLQRKMVLNIQEKNHHYRLRHTAAHMACFVKNGLATVRRRSSLTSHGLTISTFREKSLVQMLVFPYFDYVDILLTDLSSDNKTKLQRAHNFCNTPILCMFMVCAMEVPYVPSLNMNDAFRTEGYLIEEYLLSMGLDERLGDSSNDGIYCLPTIITLFAPPCYGRCSQVAGKSRDRAEHLSNRFPNIVFSYFIVFRHPIGEIELSASFCYELQTSGKSRPQRIPTSFDVPTSDGSLPKANQTIGLPLLRRTHVPI